MAKREPWITKRGPWIAKRGPWIAKRKPWIAKRKPWITKRKPPSRLEFIGVLLTGQEKLLPSIFSKQPRLAPARTPRVCCVTRGVVYLIEGSTLSDDEALAVLAGRTIQGTDPLCIETTGGGSYGA